MAINYAESYQQALQEGFYDGHLFSVDLWNSPSNSLVKFDGAKHIKLPKLTIDEGRKDRTRRTITQPVANYSNDWDSYELTNERYWSTLVDPSDVDETNTVVSIANITKQFNLQEKMPEKDREMFSKLFTQKETLDSGKGIATDTLSEQNILEAFDNMMVNFDEARIPSQNRILYVTPKTNAMLKRADAINRSLVLNDPNNIQRTVYSLDDVTIKVVPSDLMQTKYNFETGSALVDDAKQIEMMLIYNGVQIAPEKYNFVGFDAPSAANSGNYLYYENSYDDVLLLRTKTAGIEFVVGDKAKGVETHQEKVPVKPTSSSTKKEITDYLTAQGVDFDSNASKDDLLKLVK
ncbi:capsid protein [Lactobacillus sp. PSON]|uniref:capsid protein n=1 Tax=Lactobacillus sp. PSON TaxID=3455454 RepID=UPI004041B7DF